MASMRMLNVLVLMALVCLPTGIFGSPVLLKKKESSDELVKDLEQAGSPKDQMIAALDALSNEIHAEQNAAHEEYTAHHAKQTEFINSKKQDLANERTTLANAEKHNATLNANLDTARTELANLETDKSNLEKTIADTEENQRTLAQERQARKENRAKIVQDHHDALGKLDTIVDMVEAFRFEDAESELSKVTASSSVLKKKAHALHYVVQQALVMMKSSSPEEKNSIKQLLLNLLTKIRTEVDKSRALYERDEAADHETWTQVNADLNELLDSYRADLASLVKAISDKNAHIDDLVSQIAETEAHIHSTKDKIAALEKLIADTEKDLEAATQRYNSETQERNRQLETTEEARAYILANIHGMTVAETCHVEAKDCPRCLYDAHCQEGEICGSDGHCTESSYGYGYGEEDEEEEQGSGSELKGSYTLVGAEGTKVAKGQVVGDIPEQAMASKEYTYLFYINVHKLPNHWNQLLNVQPAGSGSILPLYPGVFLNENRHFSFGVATKDNHYEYTNSDSLINFDEWMFVAFSVSESARDKVFYHRVSGGTLTEQHHSVSSEVLSDGTSKVYLCDGDYYNENVMDAQIRNMVFVPRALSPAEVQEYDAAHSS